MTSQLQKLVGMWKVHGFVDPDNGERLRDVGESLDGLIQRNEVLRLFKTKKENVLAGCYASDDDDGKFFYVVLDGRTKNRVVLKAPDEVDRPGSYELLLPSAERTTAQASPTTLVWKSLREGINAHAIRWKLFHSQAVHPLMARRGRADARRADSCATTPTTPRSSPT